MGWGPKDIQAYLINDLLVVRRQGVLIVAKQQLVKSRPAENERDLLRRVRIRLIETARPVGQRPRNAITITKRSTRGTRFNVADIRSLEHFQAELEWEISAYQRFAP